MKKIIMIIMALAINSFVITSAVAEGSPNDGSVMTTEQIQSALENESVADMLEKLLNNGMGLQSAVQAILNAGGNSADTLTAALEINSEFEFAGDFNPIAGGGDYGDYNGGDYNGNDPVADLAPSAGGAGRTFTFNSGGGSGGGGGAVSP